MFEKNLFVKLFCVYSFGPFHLSTPVFFQALVALESPEERIFSSRSLNRSSPDLFGENILSGELNSTWVVSLQQNTLD